MYLTAHRVVSPGEGTQGVNAFYRKHGEAWAGLNGDPERAPSRLVRSKCSMAPNGNRIRSYLDVLATDEAGPGAVLSAFHQFLQRSAPDKFPCDVTIGTVRLRLGLERSLAASWRAEAQRLFNACLQVWIGDDTPERGLM